MPTATADSETSAVPLIDFGKFLHGTASDQAEIAAQIDEAFCTVGFVCLRSHGVPQEKVDECFEWSARFFNLPEETKMLAPHPPGGSYHRGYSGLGKEKVSQNVFDDDSIKQLRQIPDVKESFESGNVNDTAQPNIWPPENALPGFRTFMESFFLDCTALIHTLLRALALSLSLPSLSTLSAAHSSSLFQLRLLHYPSVPLRALAAGEKARIGAHSDFGTLTLLFQDGVGGLEVEDPARPGEFRAVRPIEGTVLVNVGDLMARWSNDRWRSTVHRVGAPPRAVGFEENGEEGGVGVVCRDRYSIPFFATADSGAVIEALPGCWGEDRPKKYEPVTAGEYIQMRMAALY